jgi:formylglycine-generating enzyme required for sulfatase activity
MDRMKSRRIALLVFLVELSLVRSGEGQATKRLRFVVLPLRPLAECSPSVARAFTRTLKERLRALRVQIVQRAAVEKAKALLGPKDGKGWTTEQLVALGREVGADRVLAGALRLQAMRRAPGDVWELEVEQIDARLGRARGSFKRVTAFGRAHGVALMRSFVQRILDHDPDAPPLVMKDPAPMKAPEGAPQEPGMAYVPAGEFIMGSERGEIDEEPRHVVYTDAFFIDLHEVTNAEYDRCVAAGRCQRSTARRHPKLNAPNQPVAGVGYQDAVDFCAFAGKRLLSEAEWEKAARGSDERVFPWGNEWHEDRANMAWDRDGFTHAAPVGSFPRGVSPYGVHDLAGNVWEWTADVYDPGYYRRSPARNPKGPAESGDPRKRRVMRGGSWMYDVPFFLATPNRSPGRPYIRKMWVGIRCGKDAPRPAP